MSVKVEQIDEYLFSDTLQSQKNKMHTTENPESTSGLGDVFRNVSSQLSEQIKVLSIQIESLLSGSVNYYLMRCGTNDGGECLLNRVMCIVYEDSDSQNILESYTRFRQ